MMDFTKLEDIESEITLAVASAYIRAEALDEVGALESLQEIAGLSVDLVVEVRRLRKEMVK